MVLFDVALLVVFTFVLSRMACISVEQAGKLSDYLGISRMAVGMLVVGGMVALPELAIAVTSSATTHGELAAGNVFGANVTLILFGFGVAAFLYGFKVERKNLEDLGFALMLTFLICIYIIFVTQVVGRSVGFYEGLALFLVFAWYAVKMVIDKALSRRNLKEDLAHFDTGLISFGAISNVGLAGPTTALLFAGSVLAVYVSSTLVVNSALTITASLGLAQSFIAATFIALGTALPEMMVCLEAVKKKMYALALGDAMGSVMANMTLVLGTAAVIQPVSLHLQVFGVAMLFAVLASVMFFYYAALRKKFDKREGAILLALYGLYLVVISASQLGFL